jgi:hypothetical protein
MPDFTITKANRLGEHDEKYGQRWWAEVKEQKEPVMFNTMRMDDIEPGDVISAEEILLKTSSKGTEYHGLKKVTLGKAERPDVGGTPPQGTGHAPQSNELLELVKENNKMLKQLLGTDDAPEPDFGD